MPWWGLVLIGFGAFWSVVLATVIAVVLWMIRYDPDY